MTSTTSSSGFSVAAKSSRRNIRGMKVATFSCSACFVRSITRRSASRSESPKYDRRKAARRVCHSKFRFLNLRLATVLYQSFADIIYESYEIPCALNRCPPNRVSSLFIVVESAVWMRLNTIGDFGLFHQFVQFNLEISIDVFIETRS